MDAHCNCCGGSVMPYRQYAVYFRPTACCATCGARVRLRGFLAVATGSLAAFLATLWVMIRMQSLGTILLIVAGLGLFALIADLWTYRNLSWDPVEAEPGRTQVPTGEATARRA